MALLVMGEDRLKIMIDPPRRLVDLDDYVAAEIARLLAECVPVALDPGFAGGFAEQSSDFQPVMPDHVLAAHRADNFSTLENVAATLWPQH